MHGSRMIAYLMEWLQNYHLFLLDFDGLLVNTEKLHFEAYKRLCKSHGFTLAWSFHAYCKVAMRDSTALKEAILEEFPPLAALKWETLYEEKKRHYLEVLEEVPLEFMPGVEAFLAFLEKKQLRRCVVTNSFEEQIISIRKKLPLLDSIPFWVTRQQYHKAKPEPDSYLKALELYGQKGDKVVGFEDSPRGLRALLAAGVDAVMVSAIFAKDEVEEMPKDFSHIASFESLSKAL